MHPLCSPDHVVNEANGLSGAAAQGACADGVDTHAMLAPRLVRQHLGVTLQRLKTITVTS